MSPAGSVFNGGLARPCPVQRSGGKGWDLALDVKLDGASVLVEVFKLSLGQQWPEPRKDGKLTPA